MIISTTETIAGREISEIVGLARGNVIRAKHIGTDIVAGLRNLVGGEVSEYTKLMAEAREQALDRMKFLNNFINQLTPFFFYSVGGYLAIKGQITVGALVAALAAYKDLSSPWKDLLAYYNQTQDMRK